MDEKRKGEIAINVLMYFAHENGVTLPPSAKSIKKFAQQLGVSENEMREFIRDLAQDLIATM